MDVKISVIIPVYNIAAYVDQAVSSWVNQTLTEIEIILINDASTDESAIILKRWEETDDRIRVISFNVNRSAWTARKAGIEEAKGEYLLFADADDTVLPETCAELYREMKHDPVDILQFQTKVVDENGLPKTIGENMKRFLQPYKGKIKGKYILRACFLEEKFGFTLWNKLYSTSLCKKAFSDQKEAVLPRAQDKLAFFIIAYYASSYRGFFSKPYYNYLKLPTPKRCVEP